MVVIAFLIWRISIRINTWPAHFQYISIYQSISISLSLSLSLSPSIYHTHPDISPCVSHRHKAIKSKLGGLLQFLEAYIRLKPAWCNHLEVFKKKHHRNKIPPKKHVLFFVLLQIESIRSIRSPQKKQPSFTEGSASNLFTLLAGGDVALSVLMTITTTIGAVTRRHLVVRSWTKRGPEEGARILVNYW